MIQKVNIHYPRRMKIRMFLENQLQPIMSCFSSYSSSFNYAIKFFLFTLPNPVSSRVSARCTMCSTLRILMKVGFDFPNEQFILAHMSFLRIRKKRASFQIFLNCLAGFGEFQNYRFALKFAFSKKAKRIDEIFTVDLTLTR